MLYHQESAKSGRWNSKSFAEQMANIGSEVVRAIKWKNRDHPELFQPAFERMLELIDLTAEDRRNRKRLRELLRVRELLVDHLMYDNFYQTTDEQWKRYFFSFNYLRSLLVQSTQ